MWKKTILVFKIKVLDYSSNILCLLRVPDCVVVMKYDLSPVYTIQPVVKKVVKPV